MSAIWFKDDPELRSVPLVPPLLLKHRGEQSPIFPPVVSTFNRLGGLMTMLAAKMGVDVATILAVWLSDCHRIPHTPGRAWIHFDVGSFRDTWVKTANQALFDQHFHYIGRNRGVQGYRRNPTDAFIPVHEHQESEYAALDLAMTIGGQKALHAVRIGCPKLSLWGFSQCGYASVETMFDVCQKDERWHALGHFDRMRNGWGFEALCKQDWYTFSLLYHRPCSYTGREETAKRLGKQYLHKYAETVETLARS